MTTWRRTSGSVLTAALLASVLGACAHSSPTAGPSATPSPSSVPTSAQPSPSLATCTSAQVRVRLWHDVGATMQQAGAWFGVTNVGATACTLRGYPQVALLDSALHPIGVGPARRGSGYLIEDPGVRLVRVEPGASAFFAVGWTDADMANGGTTQGCGQAALARVTLPGADGPVTVSAKLAELVCPDLTTTPPSNAVTVTAVNAAAAWTGRAAQPPASPDPSG